MTHKAITIVFAAVLLAASAMAGEITEPMAMPGSPGYGEQPAGLSYLGVDTQEITADRVAALRLKEERGVEITMVDQDAPAGKAGLKEHDVVVEFNGQRVEGAEQFRRMIHEMPPGRTVTLGIIRNGQPMSIQAKLGSRKEFAAKWSKGAMQIPPIPRLPAMPAFDVMVRTYSRVGITVDNLTPQLGEFFGVKNGEGVLVRAVEKGSPAEAAGLRAGDVIVRVDNDRISDKGDWRGALRTRRTGKITLGIVRDKREQTLSITVPEPKPDEESFRIELPEFDFDFEELETALYRYQPLVQRATRQALVLSEKQLRKTMQEAGKELERKSKCLEKRLQQAEKEMDQAEKQLEKTVVREQ